MKIGSWEVEEVKLPDGSVGLILKNHTRKLYLPPYGEEREAVIRALPEYLRVKLGLKG